MVKFLQLSIFDSFFGSSSKSTVKRHPVRRTSDPLLETLWKSHILLHFPERRDLLDYTVTWSSRRQKRTLASCNIKQRRVVVARELNYPQHHQWLDPLLYHEMCHAVLGFDVVRANGKRQWHGRQFRELERKHPGVAELDHWIKSGGWRFAVRSERARSAFRKRSL